LAIFGFLEVAASVCSPALDSALMESRMGDRVIASLTTRRGRAEACILRNGACKVVKALLSRRDGEGAGALHVATLRAPLMEGLKGGGGAYSDLIHHLLDAKREGRLYTDSSLGGLRSLGIAIGGELEAITASSVSLRTMLEQDPHWLAFRKEILLPSLESSNDAAEQATQVSLRLRPRGLSAEGGPGFMLRGDEVEVDASSAAIEDIPISAAAGGYPPPNEEEQDDDYDDDYDDYALDRAMDDDFVDAVECPEAGGG